jgi:hypothetical protein
VSAFVVDDARYSSAYYSAALLRLEVVQQSVFDSALLHNKSTTGCAAELWMLYADPNWMQRCTAQLRGSPA